MHNRIFGFDVVTNFDELVAICNDIKSPWINKHMEEFIELANRGFRENHKGMIFRAIQKLNNIQNIIASRGYVIDSLSVLADYHSKINVEGKHATTYKV